MVNLLRKFAIGMFAIAAINTALADTVTFFHNDLSGSPLIATDASGNLLWKENYKPYGDKLTQSTASAANKIGFHGKEFDSATSLSYMGSRYYDPILGRFISADPVGYTTDNLHSFNRYTYANNNPYKFVDPDGRSSVFGAFAQALTAFTTAFVGAMQSIFGVESSINSPDGSLGSPGGQSVQTMNWSTGQALELAASNVDATTSPSFGTSSTVGINTGTAIDLAVNWLARPMLSKSGGSSPSSTDSTDELPDAPIGKLTPRSDSWWEDQGIDPHEEKKGWGDSRRNLATDRAGNVWTVDRFGSRNPEYIGKLKDMRTKK